MMPKSTGTRSPLASTKMLPGCMSAWKKPSRNTCLKKLSAARGEDLVGIEAGRDQRGALVGGDAADPLERQHPARGALPVDPRHAEALVAGEVLGELGGGRGLEAQVHLEPGPEREGLDHLDRLEAAVAGLQALDPGREPGEEVEVARHLALDAGPQHLDRDLLARGW